MNKRTPGPFSVSPIGLRAMRLTGPNVFGPPHDRPNAITLLRQAVDRGVNHIDTAQYYGPDVVNDLIRKALYPYPPRLVIVTKVGARRDTTGGVFAADAPDLGGSRRPARSLESRNSVVPRRRRLGNS